jgi:hypothetical protein
LGNACENRISEEEVARARGSALSHCGSEKCRAEWGCIGAAAVRLRPPHFPIAFFNCYFLGVFRGTWMFGWWCDCFLLCLRGFIGAIEFVVMGVCLQIVRSEGGRRGNGSW